MRHLTTLLLILACIQPPQPLQAQDDGIDPALLQALEYRNVGPYRGGRATAVTGVTSQPMTYYMGATGGGVWKTTDGGQTWQNVSDGFFNTGSVGAIAVAESDPNVVYVGMGESPIRGVMTTHGDGVYKSTDAGKTWTHLGLEMTRQISKIAVHPTNPDVVFVAAQGNMWTTSPERGIYRSTDGGASWDLVLHVDDGTGASDLSMDPTNPRILYAAFWTHQRLPWKVISGGDGSGIWKSTDGGSTWTELSEGLPDLMGKIGVAVSPADPERVFAIIEAEEGGLYRSDDAGESWQRINSQRVIQTRSWYYMHIFADPLDAETVYVLNAPFLKSVDGGRSFQPVATPHGDNHDLWINPNDNRVMINSNDGGANVSFNGGATWTAQDNQPTAQFYRVIADNQFPYRLYGGQQDNSTVSIASRTMDASISREDWQSVGGCESAHVAFDPNNPRYVYAGCYQGIISEYDTKTHTSRSVMAYQYLGLGENPVDLKYRFNWNAPILVSQHNPQIIYHAGNVVLKSMDRGQSWTAISDDLTRNDPERQQEGGGPITNEAAGAETYNTIMYLAESPHDAQTLWVGTDDGLVHITRDGGATWTNVTPPDVGEQIINAIDVSTHAPGTAYLAVTGYKTGDYTPYAYKTTNYGQRWTQITEGIPDEAHVRVVREDPARRGLLYAGTEAGLFISFDDGDQWQPFQQNLPIVPVSDLRVHHGDLVVATQGRGFWILDDLSPLHQSADQLAMDSSHLFAPRPGIRTEGSNPETSTAGRNPAPGVLFHYVLPEPAEADTAEAEPISAILEILDGNTVIRTIKSKGAGEEGGSPLPVESGLNRYAWDFRHDNIDAVSGHFTFGSTAGHRVQPGTYAARLIVAADTLQQPFVVVDDPRSEATPTQWNDQAALLADIMAHVDAIHKSVADMRAVRDQVNDRLERTVDHPEADTLATMGVVVNDAIGALEKQLVQPQQKTFQDVINYPNQLNAHFLNLASNIDGSGPMVTQGMRDRYDDLVEMWSERQAELQRIMDEDVAAFNALYASLDLPAIIVPVRDGE